MAAGAEPIVSPRAKLAIASIEVARPISGIWRRRYTSRGFHWVPRRNAATRPEKPASDIPNPAMDSRNAVGGIVRSRWGMFANSPCGLTLTALAAAAAWSEAQHQLSGYPGFVHIRGFRSR